MWRTARRKACRGGSARGDSFGVGLSIMLRHAAQIWDDRAGKPLDAETVWAASQRTFESWSCCAGVWTRREGAPIGVRWIDVDEGFGAHGSRMAAKDFKPLKILGWSIILS